ncbi:response regulator transcription factor [Paenibacillus sp. SYP-B4298]|uniref:response regulator transcription factor n=1 Tax=Paenibacillus sp. SYP-B4298 TaxID=2996034 RepID=UPI0022DD339C|nr:response regulator [Paenibacillus sp. SYP-B4298]
MLKVMVIEDELTLRKGLVWTTPWDTFGCEVVGECADGREGAELIRKLQPDIVVTDIRMPGLTGIEMMQEVRTVVDTEFIFITGYSDFKYAKAAIDLGAQGFILKPIDDEELEAILLKAADAVRRKKRYDLAMATQASGIPELYGRLASYENGRPNDRYLQAAIDYINCHIERNFSLKDIADHLYISESYLSKLFKSKTSYTFLEYCTHHRLKKAADLLTDPAIKVYEVAERVGYPDSRYFSTLFKKWTGLTPTEFRSYYMQE